MAARNHDPKPPLHDRRQAGQELAKRLHHLADESSLILGLSGGGVVVAAVIAEALGQPMDILSMAGSGSTRLRLEATSRMRSNLRETGFLNAAGGTAAAAQSISDGHMLDMEARSLRRPDLPDVTNRTVVLVDDGLHPDTAVHAALGAVRYAGATHIVLATPFLTQSSADLHNSELDELVALEIPAEYGAASELYEESGTPKLADVQALLQRFRVHAA